MIDIAHGLIASGKSTLFSGRLVMRVLAKTKHCTIFQPVALCEF